MTELSKFINLLIEFEEKIEGHLNKKYKPFCRKIINLDSLAKNVDPNRIKLTKELIVFKLGLEAKSHKAVEISLSYLLVKMQLSRKCSSSSLWTSTCPTTANYTTSKRGVSRKKKNLRRNKK
jgi:hypothetical protein